MATTKKATTGRKAVAGARKGEKPAKGVASKTKTKATAKTASTPRPAPAVKLTDGQREFLCKVKDAGAAGYTVARKTEQRTIDALLARKVLKKGAKNRETGLHSYLLSKAGEKHLPAAPPAPAPAPAIAPEPAPAPPQAAPTVSAPPPAL
jgi:hypothetical protein